MKKKMKHKKGKQSPDKYCPYCDGLLKLTREEQPFSAILVLYCPKHGKIKEFAVNYDEFFEL